LAVFGREVTAQHERHSAWAVQRIRLEIAYILRDHRDRADVKKRLQETLKRGQSAELVLVEPDDPLLDQIPYGPKEIAQQFSDWATALHLVSARSGAEEFVEVALATINQPRGR
jgi:hypothetical protein